MPWTEQDEAELQQLKALAGQLAARSKSTPTPAPEATEPVPQDAPRVGVDIPVDDGSSFSGSVAGNVDWALQGVAGIADSLFPSFTKKGNGVPLSREATMAQRQAVWDEAAMRGLKIVPEAGGFAGELTDVDLQKTLEANPDAFGSEDDLKYFLGAIQDKQANPRRDAVLTAANTAGFILPVLGAATKTGTAVMNAGKDVLGPIGNSIWQNFLGSGTSELVTEGIKEGAQWLGEGEGGDVSPLRIMAGTGVGTGLHAVGSALHTAGNWARGAADKVLDKASHAGDFFFGRNTSGQKLIENAPQKSLDFIKNATVGPDVLDPNGNVIKRAEFIFAPETIGQGDNMATAASKLVQAGPAWGSELANLAKNELNQTPISLRDAMLGKLKTSDKMSKWAVDDPVAMKEAEQFIEEELQKQIAARNGTTGVAGNTVDVSPSELLGLKSSLSTRLELEASKQGKDHLVQGVRAMTEGMKSKLDEAAGIVNGQAQGQTAERWVRANEQFHNIRDFEKATLTHGDRDLDSTSSMIENPSFRTAIGNKGTPTIHGNILDYLDLGFNARRSMETAMGKARPAPVIFGGFGTGAAGLGSLMSHPRVNGAIANQAAHFAMPNEAQAEELPLPADPPALNTLFPSSVEFDSALADRDPRAHVQAIIPRDVSQVDPMGIEGLLATYPPNVSQPLLIESKKAFASGDKRKIAGFLGALHQRYPDMPFMQGAITGMASEFDIGDGKTRLFSQMDRDAWAEKINKSNLDVAEKAARINLLNQDGIVKPFSEKVVMLSPLPPSAQNQKSLRARNSLGNRRIE